MGATSSYTVCSTPATSRIFRNRFGARFVLLVGAAVLAVGALVSQLLAPETTDLDLATAARTTREPKA
ncbi:hypothetical protein ACFV2N_01635 [Streptomyces sp. NPDC059680]|uniref:hypothetical protein n=1 Tax=Streptomyces sp. NPDC059680 TaxID=3346904 RepID=UPI0036C1E64A